MGKDYHKILNVDKNASDDDIKKAYKKMALQYHPDKNSSQEAKKNFQDILEAYNQLSRKDRGRSKRSGDQASFTSRVYRAHNNNASVNVFTTAFDHRELAEDELCQQFSFKFGYTRYTQTEIPVEIFCVPSTYKDFSFPLHRNCKEIYKPQITKEQQTDEKTKVHKKNGLKNGSNDDTPLDIKKPFGKLQKEMKEKKKKSIRELNPGNNIGAEVSDSTDSDKTEYKQAFNVINDTLKAISEAQEEMKTDKERSRRRGKSSVNNNRIKISSGENKRGRTCSEGRHSGVRDGTGSKMIRCPLCNVKISN